MDQTQQPKGNFVVSHQRYAKEGQPKWRGTITMPGSERKLPIAVWSKEYPDKTTGEMKIVHSGQVDGVSTSDTPLQQVKAISAGGATKGPVLEEKGVKLEAGRFVIFENGFKNEEGVDPDKLAKRPEFYGYFNPGEGEKMVSISVWAREGTGGRAFLAGATQYPLPGKDAAKDEAPERDLQDLVETGEVTRGMPAKGRRRSEGRAA